MTTATSLRGAFLMCFGGLIGGAGSAIAVLGGFSVIFPWNITCIIVGILLAIGGGKLFIKGHDS
jgi:hypothetical protein